MRRIKPILLGVGILLSGAILLAWTMTWYVVRLREDDTVETTISVAGDVAAPALATLGLAGLASIAALAIAGPAFRVVLGILQAVLGGLVAWSAWGALSNPAQASAPVITETTGISGDQSVIALVDAVSATAWPVLTVVLGILLTVTGIVTAATSRRWPRATSRYQATRFEDADEPRSAVSDWDSLSDGSDPTSR